MQPKQIIPEAQKYRLEPATLWALILTESSGSGFLPDGRPRILFERHILWKRLLERGISPVPLAQAKPSICGSRWEKKHYIGGVHEHTRMEYPEKWAHIYQRGREESYRKASLESASWGLFQIMGYHFRICGHENVDLFVEEMKRSETAQVEMGLRWIKNVGLLDDLQRKSWVSFVRGYNGSGQIPYYVAKFQYNYLRSKKYFK